MEPGQSPAGHDLSHLRIEDRSRHPRGGAAKKLGLFSAAVGLLLIVAGIIFAFRTTKPVVEVAAARGMSNGGAATLLNASGYVTPRRRATIAAKITGRVTAVNFDEGMHVREGFVLATLDDSDVRRSLESATADRNASQAAIADLQVQLKFAEIELQRAQQLQAQGVQSQEGLDTARTNADSLRAKIALAKSQVLSAEARINEAQQAVDNCMIRAPFEGIVVSKDAQVGGNGVADFRGRRIYPHRNRHHGGYAVAMEDRSRRQRGLHRSSAQRPERDRGSRCVSRLANSLARCAP